MLDAWTGDTIYLDTNIIIFAIEQNDTWSPILRELFEAIDRRAVHGFTSELALAEILVKPIAQGAGDLIDKYKQVLAPDGIIRVVPIDRAILYSAAEIRATAAIKLMDAIHLATAKLNACEFFLTNDEDLGKKVTPELRWIKLADLVESKK